MAKQNLIKSGVTDLQICEAACLRGRRDGQMRKRGREGEKEGEKEGGMGVHSNSNWQRSVWSVISIICSNFSQGH